MIELWTSAQRVGGVRSQQASDGGLLSGSAIGNFISDNRGIIDRRPSQSQGECGRIVEANEGRRWVSGSTDLARGLVAGVTAGLVASLVMSAFQEMWTSLDRKPTADGETKSKPATANAADKISKAVSGKPVRKAAENVASEAIHYITGAAVGGIYGALAAYFPRLAAGGGGCFGGAVWLSLDEGAAPMLALSPPFSKVSPKQHVYALASHLVFGMALEFSRAVFVRRLSGRLAAKI